MVKQKLKKGGSGIEGVQQPVIQPLGQKALDPSSPSSNIGVLVFIGPYILISFFLLLSIFNSNLKGLMYFVIACNSLNTNCFGIVEINITK